MPGTKTRGAPRAGASFLARHALTALLGFVTRCGEAFDVTGNLTRLFGQDAAREKYAHSQAGFAYKECCRVKTGRRQGRSESYLFVNASIRDFPATHEHGECSK